MTKVLIGADPEFFLKDKKENFVSAHDKLPGNKNEPYKVKSGAVQVDGLACEFNINPARSSEEFVDNIHTVLGELRKMIPPEFSFNFAPYVVIKKDYFDSLPEEARELGCNPDMNVYLKGFNPTPKNRAARTGSGHIHIGWTDGADIKNKEHLEDCEFMIGALDRVYESNRRLFDRDTRRQGMYGSIGSYRPKPYGVEYRTPSNAWLAYPNLWPWIFNVGKLTHDILLEKGFVNGSSPNYYYTGLHAWNIPLERNVHKDLKFPVDWSAKILTM